MSQTPFDISVSRELVYSFNVPIVWVWYGSYTDIFISPLLQHQYVVRQRNREYSLTVCGIGTWPISKYAGEPPQQGYGH